MFLMPKASFKENEAMSQTKQISRDEYFSPVAALSSELILVRSILQIWYFFLLESCLPCKKIKNRVIFLVCCCGAVIFQLSQILKGPLDPVTGGKIKGASKGQCFLAFS